MKLYALFRKTLRDFYVGSLHAYLRPNSTHILSLSLSLSGLRAKAKSKTAFHWYTNASFNIDDDKILRRTRGCGIGHHRYLSHQLRVPYLPSIPCRFMYLHFRRSRIRRYVRPRTLFNFPRDVKTGKRYVFLFSTIERKREGTKWTIWNIDGSEKQVRTRGEWRARRENACKWIAASRPCGRA